MVFARGDQTVSRDLHRFDFQRRKVISESDHDPNALASILPETLGNVFGDIRVAGLSLLNVFRVEIHKLAGSFLVNDFASIQD
jgi:hypothetical protein